jgi:hypothetical protein
METKPVRQKYVITCEEFKADNLVFNPDKISDNERNEFQRVGFTYYEIDDVSELFLLLTNPIVITVGGISNRAELQNYFRLVDDGRQKAIRDLFAVLKDIDNYVYTKMKIILKDTLEEYEHIPIIRKTIENEDYVKIHFDKSHENVLRTTVTTTSFGKMALKEIQTKPKAIIEFLGKYQFQLFVSKVYISKQHNETGKKRYGVTVKCSHIKSL